MAEYIERESLLKDIENDSMAVLFDKTSAIHHIKNQPAADVAKVRHGKWDNNGEFYQCSVCTNFTGCDYDYCPYCGAKMISGINDLYDYI